MAKRSATKKIAIGAIVLLVVLVMLIALAPMLVSAGVGHGAIRSAIEDQLAPGSRAQFQSLRVTWRGPQEIRGLRIIDRRGQEVADVNMRISPGLFSLIFGTAALLEAEAAGTLRAELYEDGTTSIDRYLVEPDPRPRPPRERPHPMANVPPTILRVPALDVHLTYAETGERVLIDDLAGEFRYAPQRRGGAEPSEMSFEFTGRTLAADVQGDVRLIGSVTNLFDAAGAITPQNAPMNLELTMNSIPVLGMDVPATLTNLVLLVASENLAENVRIEAEGEAEIQDEPPSRFRAEIGVRVPMTPEGRLDARLENIEGTVRGERVPSSIIQPFLANTPIVLTRDVGRSVNVDLQLTPAADGLATVNIVGERASLDLAARHDADTDWWHGNALNLVTPRAHPDLVHGFTNLTVDRHVNLEIRMTAFAFPPVDPTLDRRPLSQYGGTGVLRVNEPVALLFEPADDPNGAVRSVLLEQAEIEFDAPALGERLDLAGALRIEGADVRLQERITNLFDAEGQMDVMAADIVGELVIDGLPSHTVAQWMPEQDEIIRELLGEQLNASLITSRVEQGLQANLTARAGALETNLVAMRRPDALEISQTWAEFTLTPRMVAHFQRDAEEPITLVQSTRARLEFDPITLPGRALDEYRLRERDLRGRLLVEDLVVDQVPGLAEPVSLRELNANVLATLARDPLADDPVAGDEPLLGRYALEGGVNLRRAADGANIANVTYNIAGQPRPEQTELSGSLTVREIRPGNLEQLMGREPGVFEMWTGDRGSLSAQFSAVGERYQATLVSDMPRLQGTFTADYADELLALRTQRANITLGAEALGDMMGGEAARINVERDVPLTLDLDSRLPLGFLTDKPFDPALLELSAEMRGGPMVMILEGERTTLDNVMIALTTNGFSDEVRFNLVIEGDERVNVRGSLTEPVRPGEPMAFGHGRANLDATLNGAPTAVADALFGLNGNLVATVGPEVNGTINAENVALRGTEDGGTVIADLQSRHGWLRGRGVVEAGTLRVARDSPFEAELEMTPLLRDVILSNLHPMFGDILTADEPLRARFGAARVPLDGDVSKLSGNLNMTIGDISLDQRSPMFAILALVDRRNRALTANIEPVDIRIRDGIVEYDRFNVTIDRFSMPYSGRINLNNRRVQLRTALPLSALQIRELDRVIPPEAAGLEVPLVQRGRLGEELRLEIDPDFDLAGQLLRFGVERGLRDLLRDLPRR